MPATSPTITTRAGAIWVPSVLLAWGAILALDPLPFQSPVPAGVPAPAWATDPTPVRQPKLRPEYRVAVYTYRCSECHRIIPSPEETQRTLTQHTEIQLRHGINTRCLNCHHRTNRDAFADDRGDEIPWDQPPLVCAKCHGPVYRDWQHGSHGRTNGYWDKTRGTQTRRKCIECHDPHQPTFRALPPAPPPTTLRMGRQDFGVPAEGHGPLRLGRTNRHGPATAAPHEEQ